MLSGTDDVLRRLTLDRAAVRRHINEGRNEEALTYVSDLLDSQLLRTAAPAIQRRFQMEKARAHRNLGQISQALECYTIALRSAHEDGDVLDEAWQLTLLAKFFGKYLNRPAFFHACLQEANRRYADEASNDRVQMRRRGVLLDLIGSYHRRLAEQDASQFQLAVAAYSEAARLHEEAQNPDGVSRAKCHLAYVRAAEVTHDSKTAEERVARLRAALDSFEHAAKHTMTNPGAIRGRATRLAQKADLHNRLGEAEIAEELATAALAYARRTKDNRAIIQAGIILATILRGAGRTSEAISSLLEAKAAAEAKRFFGLQRIVNHALIDCYFEADRKIQALPLFEENDELVRREIADFDLLGDVVNLFRTVAPTYADRYLFDGLLREFTSVLNEMLRNGRRLRDSLAAFDRTRSTELQQAIYRFAKASLGHTIKDRLSALGMELRGIADMIMDASAVDTSRLILDVAERAIDLTSLAREDASDAAHQECSLLNELTRVAGEILSPLRVQLFCETDVVFFNLMPILLRETFIHLLENVRKAIAHAPPADGTPHLVVSQLLLPDNSLRFDLRNPGLNPGVMPTFSGEAIARHGFENAVIFLAILQVDCRFTLDDDGPRTPPYRSNCVSLTVPPSSNQSFHRFRRSVRP
jgi:tetratricopeptide (TPR) repeat protein